MNIYEKLLAARVKLHAEPLEKTGWNDFSKYHYFQLADFVTPLLGIFNELKLLSIVSFTKELAQLTIINIEAPDERLVFTSPMGGAQLKGTHEIQQIGAVETYQRRYLYVMALDIIEHDGIDCTRAYEDAFTRMNNCKTLADLQEVFAQEYQGTADKQEKADIKASYDKLKASMTQKAD